MRYSAMRYLLLQLLFLKHAGKLYIILLEKKRGNTPKYNQHHTLRNLECVTVQNRCQKLCKYSHALEGARVSVILSTKLLWSLLLS